MGKGINQMGFTNREGKHSSPNAVTLAAEERKGNQTRGEKNHKDPGTGELRLIRRKPEGECIANFREGGLPCVPQRGAPSKISAWTNIVGTGSEEI